jgi:tetratricopeptide (TPR) repeat protein
MSRVPKEPLLFGAALVAVGLLSWREATQRYTSARAPSAKVLALETAQRPPEIRLGALTDAPPRAREESVFAPPRELLPLDPLKLDAPPLPPLSVRRPAVSPALQGGLSPQYRVSPEALGRLQLAQSEVVDDKPAVEATKQAEEPAKPANGAKAGTKPGAKNGAKTEAAPAPDDAQLEQRLDWVVAAGRPRAWGRILNDDPIGLSLRPGEDLRFQQVSPVTGGPLGAPFVIPRLDVEDFALARTLENDYRSRSRAIGSGPAGAVNRRTLALEMLDRSVEEPAALAFALEEAKAALAASPGDPQVLRLAACVRRVAHDLPGELEIYDQAAQHGVSEPALLAGRARLALRLGLRERAWELVQQADVAGRPTAETPLVRALLLIDESRWAEALEALHQAESLPFAGPLEDQQKRELQLLVGEVQVTLGQLDLAEREAGRVLLDSPTDVRALGLQGAVADARGQADAAAAAFSAAAALAPEDGRTLTDAGVVAWRQGDGDGARRLLLRAIDADPVHAVAPTLALGFLYEDAGREEEARDTYAQALVLEPGHAEALYRLGRRQRQDGDPAAATSTLRQALALSGPETLLLLELSRAAIDLEHWDEAQRYAREAERLEPDNPEVQWTLGLAGLHAGDVLGCIAPLEKAAAAGARGAHVALAVARYRQGQAQEALDHFDEAIKAYAGDPDDPQAQYAVAQSEAIRDNLGKRQWLDRFGRSDLQRGWTEHVWDGSPRVFLDGGAVRMLGRMERPREDERPGITRPVDGRAFFGCAAQIELPGIGETRAGLSLTYSQVKGAQGKLPKARLEIRVDTDGQVRLSVLDNFDTVVLADVPAGVTVQAGGQPLLGIERLDDVTGRFAFSVDGRRVGPEVECKSLRNFRNPFDLQVWAESAPGQQVDATVRLVRVIQAP